MSLVQFLKHRLQILQMLSLCSEEDDDVINIDEADSAL